MLLMSAPSVTPSSPPTGSGTTMSLAILPSAPMAYGQTTAPARLPPTPSKRPKLSLNTSNVPTTFSKSGTGLRLDTLSAASPTVRNTFRNAYTFTQNDAASKPRPPPRLSSIVTSIVPLASQSTPTAPTADESSSPDQTEAPASSASATSASTIESFTNCVPYKLAYNVASVLKNGPLPRNNHRARMSLPSRPIFPAVKKVSFRAPLTEDVQTTKYTLRHSDIESSVSTISTLELTPADEGSSVDLDQDRDVEPKSMSSREDADVKHAAVPRAGDKRDSSDDEEDSDTCSATPVAGRRKRGRLWAWTLSPVEPQHTPPTSDEDVATAAVEADDRTLPTGNAETGGA